MHIIPMDQKSVSFAKLCHEGLKQTSYESCDDPFSCITDQTFNRAGESSGSGGAARACEHVMKWHRSLTVI